MKSVPRSKDPGVWCFFFFRVLCLRLVVLIFDVLYFVSECWIPVLIKIKWSHCWIKQHYLMSALNQRKWEKTVMNRRDGADRVLGFIWQRRDVFQMERLGASNLRRGAGLYLVGWLALCLRRGPEGRATNSSYPKRSAFSLTFSSFGLIYWEIVLRWSEKSNTAKGSFQNLPKGTTRITKQQQPHPAFALYYEPSYML